MPWDDQDDKVLLSTTVEDRFNLWLDMHNGTIPTCVSRSVVLLRNSAINAHQRLQVLDSSLIDDGDMYNDDGEGIINILYSIIIHILGIILFT